MKNTGTFSQSNPQKELSSFPISQELLIKKIAHLDGTVLLGKPEFKHLEEYLLGKSIDVKNIEVLKRVIKDQDGFNFFRKKLKANKLEEFIKEENLLHSLPKEILEIIKGYKGREFVLHYYPATRDKTGNTEVGIDIFRKGSTDHCGHIYFYYRWDDKIKGYCIYFGWITTIIHQDAKRLGVAKQAIGLVGQLFPLGSIEMYPNITDREVITKGPKAEALVYKNLAEAGGFTETLNIDDPQISHILKINPFEHSRYAFKKVPVPTKQEGMS